MTILSPTATLHDKKMKKYTLVVVVVYWSSSTKNVGISQKHPQNSCLTAFTFFSVTISKFPLTPVNQHQSPQSPGCRLTHSHRPKRWRVVGMLGKEWRVRRMWTKGCYIVLRDILAFQFLSSMKSRNKHNVVLVLQLAIQLSLRFRKHTKYSISKHMYKTKEKYQCLPTQICILLLCSLRDPINDQLLISSTSCAESCNWISGFKLKRLDCVCM